MISYKPDPMRINMVNPRKKSNDKSGFEFPADIVISDILATLG